MQNCNNYYLSSCNQKYQTLLYYLFKIFLSNTSDSGLNIKIYQMLFSELYLRCKIHRQIGADTYTYSSMILRSMSLKTCTTAAPQIAFKSGRNVFSTDNASTQGRTEKVAHSSSLAQNTLPMMSQSLIHLPPAHHSHPPSHIHCFIPGSKLTFSTNLFHHSLLPPTWTAFSDYIGPDWLCSTVFHF